MEGSNSDKKKMSFGFCLGDDRIKLIDILSGNDDNFLVASPFCDSLQDCFSGQGGFRLSGFGNSQEIETTPQTEQNLFPSDNLDGRRPSYLRRSLAWDNAFYNSAGVLDPDELSFINKGFGTNEIHQPPGTLCVKKRRPEVEPMGNGDGFSPDWFEIEPFKSRRKSAYIPNSSLKKFDETLRNKKTGRRGKGAISSPKPPKATGRTVNIPPRLNRRDQPGKSNVKLEDSSAKIGSVFTGKSLAMEKKPASSLNPIRLSFPRFSSTVVPTAAISSTIPVPVCDTPIGASSPKSSYRSFKRKTEPRNCKLSASLSTSKVWRDSERSRGMVSTVWPSPASCASNCSSQSRSSSSSTKRRSNVPGTGFDKKSKIRGRALHNDEKEESDSQTKLQSPLFSCLENRGMSSPKQYSSRAAADIWSDGSFSAKNFRPSELRPPSPTIGFFDENTPLSSHEATSRKMSQTILSEGTLFGAKAQFRSLDIEVLPDSSSSRRDTSACKKHGSRISDMGGKIKRSKTPHMHPSLLTEREKCLKVGDGKRPRNKFGLNPSLEEEKGRGLLKNKRCKGSQGPINDTGIYDAVANPIKKRDEENGKRSLYSSEDQIGNLSKHLEAVSLDQSKKTQLKQKHDDLPSGCNKNKTKDHGTPVSPLSKQEKLLLNSPNTSSKHCPCSSLSTMVASVSSMRTPLADKSSISNFNQTSALPLDSKKEKMVQTASIYTSSQGTN